jgi:HD superfamily phosphohydrolase
MFSTELVENELMLDTTALFALESLLIARYEMFKAVYYHKTVRAAEIMLVTAMSLANAELGLTAFETPDQFLLLNDGYVFSEIRRLSKSKDVKLKKAYRIIEDLFQRRLLKMASEKYLHVPDQFTATLYTKPAVKENLESEIANLAGVDPEAVFIDIPTLPSIPYNPRALDPQALPVFERRGDIKIKTSADRLSELIKVLRGFMDVIRCFTWSKYRKEVSIAAAKVFSDLPDSAKISV